MYLPIWQRQVLVACSMPNCLHSQQLVASEPLHRLQVLWQGLQSPLTSTK